MSKIIRLDSCNPFCKYRRRSNRCWYDGSIIEIPFYFRSATEKKEFFVENCGLPTIKKFYMGKYNINKEELYKYTTISPTTFIWDE